MVAALAGTAGALAMIDERVSPALPGVAIATALNPPIAAIGLCLALGAYEGAWGAFVLFFANVLAILAVAGVMFVVAGFVSRAEIGSLGGLARRFSVAAVGLLLVTGLLTQYLVVVGSRSPNRSARSARRSIASSRTSPAPRWSSVDFDRSAGRRRGALDRAHSARDPARAREADPGRPRARSSANRCGSSCAAS